MLSRHLVFALLVIVKRDEIIWSVFDNSRATLRYGRLKSFISDDKLSWRHISADNFEEL